MEAGRFAGASAPRGGARRSRCPLGKKRCALSAGPGPRASLAPPFAPLRRSPVAGFFRLALADSAGALPPLRRGPRPLRPVVAAPRAPWSALRPCRLRGCVPRPFRLWALRGPGPGSPRLLCAGLRSGPGGLFWAPCGALFVPPPLPALPALRRGLFCGSVSVSFVLLSLGEAAATRSAGTVVQRVASGIVHQRRPSCFLPKINKTVKFC